MHWRIPFGCSSQSFSFELCEGTQCPQCAGRRESRAIAEAGESNGWFTLILFDSVWPNFHYQIYFFFTWQHITKFFSTIQTSYIYWRGTLLIFLNHGLAKSGVDIINHILFYIYHILPTIYIYTNITIYCSILISRYIKIHYIGHYHNPLSLTDMAPRRCEESPPRWRYFASAKALETRTPPLEPFEKEWGHTTHPSGWIHI